jgi:hypothetical protein
MLSAWPGWGFAGRIFKESVFRTLSCLLSALYGKKDSPENVPSTWQISPNRDKVSQINQEFQPEERG